MALNKKHEDSIGKTFKSTLLKVTLDKDALDRDYDFLSVTSNGEEDHTPVISDPKDTSAFSDGRICGTFAEWKKLYVMFRKNPKNVQELRTYLDSKGDDFTCEISSAAEMRDRTLLNLLLNSSRHELNDYMVYNNLDGKLFITYPKWKTKDHVTTVKAIIERQSLGFVLSLSATMFSRIGSYRKDEDREGAYKKPMYVITKENGDVHRIFKPGLNNYVIGNSGLNRAEVPYSDPKTADTLKLSKNYIFDLVIGDINSAFEKYLKIEKESLTIEDYLHPEGIDVDTFMEELKSKIVGAEYVLINTTPDVEDAIRLEEIVIETLKTKFGKGIEKSDKPVKGKFNICIIHDEAYYKRYELEDEYKIFPGFVVQHLTVENCITDRKEDAIDSIMNVLIKELFIKDCVANGRDLIGNWGNRNFDDDIIFLKREKIRKKPRMYRIFRLTMHPNGQFDIDCMDDNDPFLSDVVKNNWEYNGKTSEIEHVIIYKGNVCAIENSGIVPVIDNDVLFDGIKNKKSGRGKGNDGLGTRGYVTYNNALYAITDIQRLSFDGKLLYMCGYDGSNLAKKYTRAPNIRLVTCINGENFFAELLELMNVPFVRYGQTTVYPYPYKFMTEYIEEQKRK